jgi:hypothetical protein
MTNNQNYNNQIACGTNPILSHWTWFRVSQVFNLLDAETSLSWRQACFSMTDK